MSEEYEIRLFSRSEFYIDITDISFKYSSDDIIGKIRKQNAFLNEREINIVRSYEYKKGNRTVYKFKLGTDGESYS